MRNKTTIIVLLGIFLAICMYNLYFQVQQFRMTGKLDRLEKAYALGDTAAGRELADLKKDETGFQKDYKSSLEKSFTLGLDLQGGMFATLEVGVDDIIRQLAPNAKSDSTFNKALRNASLRKQTEQKSYVDLFLEEIKRINPAVNLGAVFANQERGISVSSPAADVEKMLRDESVSAIDRTFNIVRTRIDQFGVVSPNLQLQASTGRIIVELPGVKEPERVRKLLRSTAKLEFWETYTIQEAFPVVSKINDVVKGIEGIDTTKAEVAKADTTKPAKGDSNAVASKKDTNKKDVAANDTSADSDTTGMSQDEKADKFRKENPFFAKLLPPDFNKIQANSPIVGYSMPEDTAKVNSYLRNEEVKAIIPDDMIFMWSLKPNLGPYHSLIAIRSENNLPVLGGDKVSSARINANEVGQYQVDMTMTIEGAQDWANITERNTGKSVAISLDNMIYSYPVVQGRIAGGRSQITGDFTPEEAKDLSNVLKAGQLPVPARIMGEDIVGPSLGASNINSGIVSFGIALLFTILFMMWYYRKSGMIATLALMFNLLCLIGASAAFGIVLTLPGMAGVILTIGMAVDANVLVFERIREELSLGKTQKAAIKAGFANAFSSIMDSNITTLLTGVVLYAFGIGPIRGFAVTLIIGILTSLVAALLFTRLILEWYADNNKNIDFGSESTLKMFKGIDIKFSKNKGMFYKISAAMISISIISMIAIGFKTGVDFKGGRQYMIEMGKTMAESDMVAIRGGLEKSFGGEAPVVKTLSSASRIQVTTSYKQDVPSAGQEVQDLMMKGLNESVKGTKPQILSTTDVGPTVANDIKTSALLSVIFSLLIIGLYILVRFYKWQYSVGAVASLVHDVIIVLGLFSIFSIIPMPFSVEIDQAFIAAILTLIGYSINDTVVVFDRIRENLAEHPHVDLSTTFDNAINETLSRTLITAGTTLLSALVLLIFGGTVIKGFVFAIFMGIIFGTYSSIFVASAVALDMFLRYEERKRAETAQA